MKRLFWLVWVLVGACSSGPEAGSDGSTTPPVYFLFEIHMHNLGLEDSRPAFDAIGSCMVNLAAVLESHSVKASFGVMQHFALAVEEYETTESNLFRRLEAHGHEIGVHSLGYDQDASTIVPRIGFAPRYSAPGFEGKPRPEQLQLIGDLFLSRHYEVLAGNFTDRPMDRISAWQPSFDPDEQFTDEDGTSDVMAVNQQGMGWVGSNDLDCVRPEEFARLNRNTPWAAFLADAMPGRVTVYNVAVHEDLFTTGPRMRDALRTIGEQFPTDDPAVQQEKRQAWTELCLMSDCFAYDDECSPDALTAMDLYLTETIDPLIESGKVVSKTYSEIYDIYFRATGSGTR